MSTIVQKEPVQSTDLTADDDLPEGWTSATIGEITETVPNLKPQAMPDRMFGYVDISSICNQTYRIIDVKHFKGKDAPSRARRPITLGDVLFSNVRTYLRNIALVRDNLDAQLCSTGFTVLRSNGVVQSDVLFYQVLTDRFIDVVTPQQTGSQYPATSDRVVMSSEIPVPPLPEQKRIVAKIEELLAQVNAIRARLAKVAQILKRFRQSVLAAACSGRLTEVWRGLHPDIEPAAALIRGIHQSHEETKFGHGGKAAEPTENVHNLTQDELPDTWAVEELKFLCEPGRPITYGILKPGPNLPDGVAYVRVADFPNDRLNVGGVRKTSAKIAQEYRRSALRSGDILLSIRGTVGRVCRVPDELAGANITQDTARITVHPTVSANFIELYLRCPGVQGRLEDAMKGVAVRGVNIGDVRALQIAVPPMPEQDEIVRRVEALFKLADIIEKRIEAATKRADKLTQAILAKAFRGELVPTEAELARREGREYEAATELLTRIRVQRETSPQTMNGTRARRKRVTQ